MHLTKESFKSFLFSRQLKHAVKTAIAAVICLVLYKSFNLPKGYWAVLTAIAVMQSTADTGSLESTWKIALERLFGTMTGALAGLAIHVLINPNYEELVIAIFLLIVIGVYLSSLFPSMKYAGVTAVIVLLFAGHESISHNYAVLRAVEIFVGALIAILVSVFIWPQRMHQYLYKNYLKHMKQILDIFQAVQKCFSARHALTAEQNQAISDLLKNVDAEKVHLEHLMRTRKMLFSDILVRQIRILKNVKMISRSVGELPKDYYEDTPLMKVTQEAFFLIDKGLLALVLVESLDDLLDKFEQVTMDYENAFEAYCAKKYFEMMTMNESFAVMSLSIAIKKMLDLVPEMLKAASNNKNISFK